MNIKYISVVNDYNILNNSLLQSNGITNDNIIIIDNTIDNRPISSRYNDAIKEIFNNINNINNIKDSTWLVFCHQDFYIGEDLLSRLIYLDKNCIYGPIGISSDPSDSNKLLGRIIQSNNTYIGNTCDNCIVDTIDAMCMIINKDTIIEHNLLFDENFKYHFYIEDFCLQARMKGILTRTLQINCQHRSRTLRGDLNSPEFVDSRNVLLRKWGPIRTTTGYHGNSSSTSTIITASVLSLFAYMIYKEYSKTKI